MIEVSTASINFDIESIRAGLGAFWQESLQTVQCAEEEICLAMPLLLPDGWQMQLFLKRLSHKQVVLTDNGKIMQWLLSRGVSTKAKGIAQLMQEKLALFEIEACGYELRKVLSLPIQANEIQLFAEGMLSIAYLLYRAESVAEQEHAAYFQVEKVLRDWRIDFNINYKVTTKVKREIKVDFWIPTLARPKIAQVFAQRTRPLEIAEIWACRFQELRESDSPPRLAMIYDEATFEMDATIQRIMEHHSDLVCPSHRTDEISDFVR